LRKKLMNYFPSLWQASKPHDSHKLTTYNPKSGAGANRHSSIVNT
jgi:hypothetical protein